MEVGIEWLMVLVIALTVPVDASDWSLLDFALLAGLKAEETASPRCLLFSGREAGTETGPTGAAWLGVTDSGDGERNAGVLGVSLKVFVCTKCQ